MESLARYNRPARSRCRSLYKAMGGGWVVAAEARVPESPIPQKQTDG